MNKLNIIAASLLFIFSYTQTADARPKDFANIKGDDFKVTFGGQFSLIASPWVQDDANMDNGDYAESEGFILERARLSTKADLYKRFKLVFSLDFKGKKHPDHQISKSFKVADAYAAIPLIDKKITLKAGMHKAAGSKRQLNSNSSTQTIGVLNSKESFDLEDNRNLGASLFANYSGLSLWAGIFNGEGISRGRGNENDGFLLAGRAEYFYGKRLSQMSAIGNDSLSSGLGVFAFQDDGISNKSLTYGLDLSFSLSGFTFYTEAQYKKIEPKTEFVLPSSTRSDTEKRRMSAQAGYLLMGDMLEVIARYTVLDDLILENYKDEGDQKEIYAGLNIYFEEHLAKLQLAYVKVEEEEDFKIDNDQFLARFQLAF